MKENFTPVCCKLMRAERVIGVELTLGSNMRVTHGFPTNPLIEKSVYEANFHQIHESNRKLFVERLKLTSPYGI